MHAGAQKGRCVRVSEIVESKAREPLASDEPVPISRQRVRRERLAVSALDNEVEVGPSFPEQKPSLGLLLPVPP
jgi:hypothetical protein